ncbi:hypothetical protein D9615_007070 [Tricholomella constricta]|uniref:Uncharacterized protein n=1 Tax=Tricholomella constricta TaxID=117010 RepID=A0A8H5H888_9AGAR|nr:hypothetical protein D9615_007070 [Tricholomella constricta]
MHWRSCSFESLWSLWETSHLLILAIATYMTLRIEMNAPRHPKPSSFTMKLTSVLAILSLPVLKCRAATITFFEVIKDPYTPTISLPSETMSAIGVGADGATTYYDEVAASVFYEAAPHTLSLGEPQGTPLTRTTVSFITTITTDPVTYRATLVADASHFVYHQDPGPTALLDSVGNHLSCAFDGKGGGACVDEYWLRGRPTTVTRTYTGSLLPYYTLVVEDEQGGTKNNGAGHGAALASSAVLGAVASGFLFAFFRFL